MRYVYLTMFGWFNVSLIVALIVAYFSMFFNAVLFWLFI